MLLDVLNVDCIKAKYHVKDCSEAVIASGRLLVDNGSAGEEYIAAMLENIKVNGSYIVIAPGIAMPHARPDKGAIKTGFSVITLAEPVVFGHPKNDPVCLVIGLCAVDHQSHLKALSELIEFLSVPENVELVNNAQTKEEIFNIIEGGVKND